MNFRQASILTGLALTGLVGSSAFSPAQAVKLYKYTFSNGVLSDSGTISGNFTFDLDNPTMLSSYTSWSITVSGAGFFDPFTYTNLNSTVAQVGSTLINRSISFNVNSSFVPSGVTRRLTLGFGTRDITNIPYPTTFSSLSSSNGNLMASNPTTFESGENEITQWSLRSGESLTGNQSANRGLTANLFVTATEVPFESGALPIVGASVLFGVGVWAKSKSKSKLAEKLLTK